MESVRRLAAPAPVSDDAELYPFSELVPYPTPEAVPPLLIAGTFSVANSAVFSSMPP
jgi:hypothetical protein